LYAPALVFGALIAASTAHAGLGLDATGLECTGPRGDKIRLNIDLAAMRFQKEGFPSYPIRSMTEDLVVLTRYNDNRIVVQSSIDRKRLIYSATAVEVGSARASRTDFKCISFPPIEVAPGQEK
jgi:hypothetical protein